MNITWLINAQQSETVKTDVAVAYKDFASNNCSDSSSSDFEFEANKCIVDGSASYAYNVISQAALSAWYVLIIFIISVLLFINYRFD